MPHPGTQPCAHSPPEPGTANSAPAAHNESGGGRGGCTRPASGSLLHPFLGPDPQRCRGSLARQQLACEGCVTARHGRHLVAGPGRHSRPRPRGHSGSRPPGHGEGPHPLSGPPAPVLSPQQSRTPGCGARGGGGRFGDGGFPSLGLTLEPDIPAK